MLKKFCILTLFVFALLACMTSSASAGIYHWTGNAVGDTNWHNPNNWDVAIVPAAGDDGMIDPAGGKPMPHFVAASTSLLTLLSVGYADVSGTFYMDSGTLSCSCSFAGTKNGKSNPTSTVNMTGGTIIVDDTLQSSQVCNGGNMQWPRSNDQTGVATFNMSAGLVDVGTLNLPAAGTSATSACQGIFNLNGGKLNLRFPHVETDIAHGLFIGEDVTRLVKRHGHMNIAGGTLVVAGDATALITRYVNDGNDVIVAYPLESGVTYNKYIVSDYDKRNDGKTTVTAVKSIKAKAWQPSPIDGDEFAAKSPTLSWTAGTGATGHDVYLGTSTTLGAGEKIASDQPGTTKAAGTLVLGRKYYWKVNEIPTGQVGDIWSFTVTGRARAPSPVDGSTITTGSDRNLTLSWTAGEYSTAHSIYLGTNSASLTLQTTQTPTTYATQPDIGKTYYWRIDEVNGATTVTGNQWSYTMADYLLLDNFEIYTAQVDLINPTGPWKIKTTGSVLDLETVYKHNGLKAMSIAYNLTGGYNEAQRDFNDVTSGPPAGKDWSESGAGGAKTLTLYIRGLGNNDAIDALYVTLKDISGNLSTKVTHPDPNSIVLSEEWVRWDIATTSFAGGSFDLTSVRYLNIGFDDSSGVSLHHGKLYVDDIRLYPSRCVPESGSADEDLADISDDCVINYNDLSEITNDWLQTDSNPVPNGILTNFVGDSNWLPSGGKFSGGLSFDSINDWVDVDDLALPQFAGKTVAFWVKRGALPTGLDTRFLFGTSAEWRVNIRINSAGIVDATFGGAAIAPVLGGSTTIDTNWHHIALTISAPDGDGTVTGKLYIDGSQSYPEDTAAAHYYDVLTGACIGSMNNGQQQWAKMTIDDFRIYATDLNSANLGLLADSNISTNPPATPLIKYNFDESSGTSAAQSGSIATVYHPVGYVVSQYSKSYAPIQVSEAEIYTSEAAGSRKINFKDYAKLAKYWLYEIPNWP